MKRPLRIAASAIAAAALVTLGGLAGANAAGNQPAPTAAAAQLAAAPPVYQPDSEAKYVPITPCRIVDTRIGTGANGTPFNIGTTRNYYVGGTFGFAPQGGKSGGCGIPVGATAIAATFIAVDPAGYGGVRAWPQGQAAPTANVLNYGNYTSTGSQTVTINPSAAVALTVRNYSTSTDLVIDVFGYYVKPLAGFISPSGQPYAGSSRILGATHVGTGVYEVQFDRSIRYCSAVATVYVSAYYASTSTWYDSTRPDTVRVWLWNASGAAVDQYFYIQVDC